METMWCRFNPPSNEADAMDHSRAIRTRENAMKRQRRVARSSAGLLLALIGLIAEFSAPAYCQNRPHSALGTKALATLPSWVHTGNLNTPRNAHTATLLPNGKVLIVGRTSDDFGMVHNAELYDPAAGTWGPAASPNTYHLAHSATLLQNGNVLVAGGRADAQGDFDIPVPSRAELYDPVSNSWREVGAAIIIGGHTATLLPNAKVLMAGGSVVSPITPAGAG